MSTSLSEVIVRTPCDSEFGDTLDGIVRSGRLHGRAAARNGSPARRVPLLARHRICHYSAANTS